MKRNCNVNLREILQNNACRAERDLDVFLRVADPVKDFLNVVFFYTKVIAVTDS